MTSTSFDHGEDRTKTSGNEILDLGVIQVSGACPVQLKEVLDEGLEPPFNSYSPPAGIGSVRKIVADSLLGTTDPTSVVMTTGASGAFLSFLLVSFNNRALPRLAVPDPCYPGFLGVCRRLGIMVDTYEVKGSNISLDSFRSALTNQTIGAVLVSPGNPNGLLIQQQDVFEAEQLAANHGVPLLLDQSYVDLAQDSINHHRLSFLHPGSVQIRSFSKPFSLSGYRCGALIAAPTSANAFAQAHFSALLTAPTISQALAARCLQPDIRGKYLKETRVRLMQRQAAMTNELANINGVVVEPSDFGLFAWLRLPGDGREIARRLFKQGVVVVPGSAFGACYPNYIRVLSDISESSLIRFAGALQNSL